MLSLTPECICELKEYVRSPAEQAMVIMNIVTEGPW